MVAAPRDSEVRDCSREAGGSWDVQSPPGDMAQPRRRSFHHSHKHAVAVPVRCHLHLGSQQLSKGHAAGLCPCWAPVGSSPRSVPEVGQISSPQTTQKNLTKRQGRASPSSSCDTDLTAFPIVMLTRCGTQKSSLKLCIISLRILIFQGQRTVGLLMTLVTHGQKAEEHPEGSSNTFLVYDAPCWLYKSVPSHPI